MAKRIRELSPGDVVKVEESGTVANFVVAQHNYQSTLNGTGKTLLLRTKLLSAVSWGNSGASVSNTSSCASWGKTLTLRNWLENTYATRLSEDILALIEPVTIPYKSASGSGTLANQKFFVPQASDFFSSPLFSGITSFYNDSFGGGADSWSAAFSTRDSSYTLDDDGYYEGKVTNVTVKHGRGAQPGNPGNVATYWTTSKTAKSSANALVCFCVDENSPVSDDGMLYRNAAPEIACNSDTALGEISSPFELSYTVSDADNDALSITEKLDGVAKATYADVSSGTVKTVEWLSSPTDFQKILNGEHTVTIEVSDGLDTTVHTTTFTKNVTTATVTLTTPLAVEGDITVAVLQVTGSVPDDAVLKAEVTNNALDVSPVWQDATEEVQKGVNIVFANKTASAGAAFNFRISVARGASGTGGYIEAISGAFQ